MNNVFQNMYKNYLFQFRSVDNNKSWQFPGLNVDGTKLILKRSYTHTRSNYILFSTLFIKHITS